ncbi:MAG: DedA family protein [Desulfovibrionaceae bacterium]|nr:DedA family protein [Desulfovibrionaceae bacterium]
MNTELLIEIVQDYGYIAILIGTFLEGETIVLVAGYLAHEEILSLPLIAICAFCGSCTSDQLMFLIGRKKGKPFLETKPRMKWAAAKVTRIMEKHETLLILGFRFLYGLRNVTPVMMGISGVNYKKFIILNIIGAAIWATSFAWGGYLFGMLLAEILHTFAGYARIVIAALLLIGAIFAVVHFRRAWRR